GQEHGAVREADDGLGVLLQQLRIEVGEQPQEPVAAAGQDDGTRLLVAERLVQLGHPHLVGTGQVAGGPEQRLRVVAQPVALGEDGGAGLELGTRHRTGGSDDPDRVARTEAGRPRHRWVVLRRLVARPRADGSGRAVERSSRRSSDCLGSSSGWAASAGSGSTTMLADCASACAPWIRREPVSISPAALFTAPSGRCAGSISAGGGTAITMVERLLRSRLTPRSATIATTSGVCSRGATTGSGGGGAGGGGAGGCSTRIGSARDGNTSAGV